MKKYVEGLIFAFIASFVSFFLVMGHPHHNEWTFSIRDLLSDEHLRDNELALMEIDSCRFFKCEGELFLQIIFSGAKKIITTFKMINRRQTPFRLLGGNPLISLPKNSIYSSYDSLEFCGEVNINGDICCEDYTICIGYKTLFIKGD